MKHVQVLFREDYYSRDEANICRKFFPVCNSRLELPSQTLVIGRYSVLPYYTELTRDLKFINSKLINSSLEHQYIANFDWYWDLNYYDENTHELNKLTPYTWFNATDALKATGPDYHIPMVLKGRTNSSKNWEWMYAPTREDFYRIDKFLHQHDTLSGQGIIYREYQELEVIEQSAIPGSHPFVNEWRCFFYKNTLLDHGYYWSVASDDAISRASDQDLTGMFDIAHLAADRLAKHTNFFVVDVAKTAAGKWIVIEVNDGQMSGLSMCNAHNVYSNLKQAVHNE